LQKIGLFSEKPRSRGKHQKSKPLGVVGIVDGCVGVETGGVVTGFVGVVAGGVVTGPVGVDTGGVVTGHII